MTGNPMITAAKMICKSIDALTREIYMLRKGVAEKDILEKEMLELDKGLKDISPVHDRTDHPTSTGCG